MIPHLKCRLHDDARVVCTWLGAAGAPRILLIGVTILAVAHLAAPRAWAQSGLVAAYSFDEGSGSAVKDASSAGNNGTIIDASRTTSGRYGAALSFNGSSAVVNVPSSRSLRLATGMTLEAWVRPSSVSTWWSDVIYKGNDNYYLMAASDNSSRPAVGGRFGSGSSTNVFGSAALPANTWTHLAATYDGSIVKLYVNGVAVASGARSGALAGSGNPLQIGGDSTFGQYFAGLIDEVRVYNVALSEAQVRADMNTPIGAASQPPPAAPQPPDLTITKTHAGSFTQGQRGAAYTLTVKNSGAGPTTGTVSVRDTLPGALAAAGISGSGWTCTVSTMTCTRSDALAAGGSYPPVIVTVNVSSSAPSSVTNTATVSGGGDSNTGNSSASDVTSIASVVSPLPLPPSSGTGLVAGYSFDEGSGTAAQDASDRNNDGSIGDATWTTAGRFGGALSFNGSSAVVNVPDSPSLHLTTAMTLEAWVRPASVSGWWSDVIYKGDDNYYLMAASDNSSRPAVGGKFGSTSSTNVFAPSQLAANTWTHLAATYDGSAVKLYVNGALAASGTRSGTLAASGNPLQIGGDSIFGQHFAGTIDEVRVYNVALTAAQVQADMNTPVGSPAAAPPSSSGDTAAPTVAISSPVAGAQVSASVTVTASASDNVGVTSVTFLVDGNAIGSDTAAPYSISWNTAAFAAGSHSLQAQARDAAGNVGTSAPVGVSIAAANVPPSITILSPLDGSVMKAPAAITLTASVAEGDGTVSRVNFYSGADLIGTRTAAPFSVNWTASAAGTYSFVAIATDNKGATATSAAVTVSVEGAASSGTAMFTASADDASVVRYVLEIFADGEDVGTAAPTGRQDLGKPPVVNGEYAADISATLAALPSGIYVATVTAEAGGGQARSAASPAFTIGSGTSSTARRPDVVTASAMSPMSTASASMSGTATAAGERSPGGWHAAAATATLWVANASTHMVAAFDAATSDVLATIPVGARPAAVAAPLGSGKVYVADEDSDTVSVIDTAAMTRVAVISLPAPAGRRPHGLAGTADGSRLFVAERGSNVVNVIDVATDQLVARFAAGQSGSSILAAIPDAAGQILYALSRADDASQNALVAIEAATGRWLWVMPIGEAVADLTIEADGRTALVSVPAKHALLFIDLERRVSMGAIDLGAGNAPEALRSSADGQVVVTMQPSSGHIGVVDAAAHVRVVALTEVSGTQRQRADARVLSYITTADGTEVVGVDTASGSIVRHFRLPGGGSASGVALDSK